MKKPLIGGLSGGGPRTLPPCDGFWAAEAHVAAGWAIQFGKSEKRL